MHTLYLISASAIGIIPTTMQILKRPAADVSMILVYVLLLFCYIRYIHTALIISPNHILHKY